MLFRAVKLGFLGVFVFSTFVVALPDWVPFFGGRSDVGRIEIPNVVVSDFLDSFSDEGIGFLFRRFGKDFSVYQGAIGMDSFSAAELRQLMKRAYLPASNGAELFRKKAAVLALQYSIYQRYSKDPEKEYLLTYRNVLFSREFLKEMFRLSDDLIAWIPPSYSTYSDVAYLALDLNPDSFRYLQLKEKLRDKVLRRVFYAKDDYFHPYQYVVAPYASKHLAKEFLGHNGMLLGHMAPEFGDDISLVYTAVFQNDQAIQFASERVLGIIDAEDVLSLNRRWARVFVFKFYAREFYQERILPVLGALNRVRLGLENRVRGWFDWDLLEIPAGPSELAEEPFWVSHRNVVRSSKAILSLEAEKGQPLLDLWRIASTGNGDVYVALFAPRGDQFLGSIVLARRQGFAFSDYLAILSRDKDSLWRYNDKGEFGPNQFSVKDAWQIKGGKLEFELIWKGDASRNLYLLKEFGSELKRSFIDYGGYL